jgi:hypothetical protein
MINCQECENKKTCWRPGEAPAEYEDCSVFEPNLEGNKKMAGKSQGFILETDQYEFFTMNGQIYKALLINPVIDGYRSGARWECPDTPHFRNSLNGRFQTLMNI